MTSSSQNQAIAQGTMSIHDRIGKNIVSLLTNDHIRLTPRDIVRHVRRKQPDATPPVVKREINKLVEKGQLIYTHHFNTSHLELNFNRAVRISNRIVISPADLEESRSNHDDRIQLLDGVVFGGGDHPTTRLVLRALDEILANEMHPLDQGHAKALDIGTGSGILALAALRLGVARSVAIDIDPLARDTAKKNAEINGLAHRMTVRDRLPAISYRNRFELILANLRPPTLKTLIPQMLKLSSPGALVILSGFRNDEQESMKRQFFNAGGRHIWGETLSGWSAFAIKLPSSPIRVMVAR